MSKIMAACLAMLVTAAVRADVEDAGSELRFFSPRLSWKISFPKEGWTLGPEKRRPDGTGYYYLATNEYKKLNFSVFIDKTDQCSSGASCRALFWRNPGPTYKNPRDVKQYEKNGFSVVQCYLDDFGGIPIKQANLSAHMYRDGYWIDIHISKVDREIPDPQSMISFLESISVK